MKQGQEERNELLRYALQHPPANVHVKLPHGFASFDNIDLALCPSPLPLYAEAEKAAANAKGEKTPMFELDLNDAIVFISGSSGGVERASPPPGRAHNKRLKTTRGSQGNLEPKLESPSGCHNQRMGTDNGTGSPNPQAESAASTDHRGKTEAPSQPPQQPSQPQSQPQRIVAVEQSPPHPSSGNPTTANAPTAASEPPEQSKGFFAHLASTFRALSMAEPPAPTGSNPANRQLPSYGQGSGSPQGIKGHQAHSSNSSGIFSSFWNPLSSTRGTRNASQCARAASPASADSGTPDTAHQMEQLEISLCGSTPATMSEMIDRQFGSVFDAVEQRRRMSGAAATAAQEFPKPPSIQLCEVLNSAPLTPFLDSLSVFAYDNLVLCTNVLVAKKRELYDYEMSHVYRQVFNISDEQHRRTVANVTPPEVKSPVNEADPAAVAERRRIIAGMRGDAALLRRLCEASSDDDYISRLEQLLYCIENYPDSPGDTQIPFAIRAMVYAACLLPLYQLDLSTLSPIYTEKDVANCLALLRARLGILPQVEKYCHLHAQLLANDQCGSVETQAVFLKDVARAVSSLGAQKIADSQLTPPVKYAYYVLQETFCLAAVPMPWLDSTFSYDMQRSVSAAFIETCLALPSCMLSAMLLVEGAPVLPPSADGEAFLLAFMEVFVNSGVFRNYAELMEDDDPVGAGRSPATAVALLQQVSNGLDTKQRAYCKILTRSFPLAMFILVPGRLRIGAYTLLVQLWNNAYPNEKHDLPKDFQPAMEAFLLYLVSGCEGDKRPYLNDRLSSLLVRSSQVYLAPFSTLAKCEQEAFANATAEQLDNLKLTWATTMDDVTEPPLDIRRCLRSVFDAPRPPPLGSDPSSQHHVRLMHWIRTAAALLQRCMDGIPDVAPAAANAKVPYLAAEYERIHAAAAAARNGNASFLPGAVHRLHTVMQLKESFCECVARAQRKYELVRRVTGAPAVATNDILEQHSQTIYDAVLQLCDTISIEILSSSTVSNMLDKFMRLDTKQYRTMKQSHGKNEDFQMPRAYPEVTMRCIIDEIKRVTAAVNAHLGYEPAVRQVHYRIGHNFVASLFAVYVDGPGVFLSTMDAPLILADLDLVRVAFFEMKTSTPSNALATDAVSNACQAAAHILRTSGAELLEKLYGIVQYVMSKPSTELINGGVGVPPLHTLPESSDDSPWCQFVVRHVLEHRKDFKKSVWTNYQTRQRSRATY